MNGYCSDCGEEYELDALNLDLRCADCVEQLVIDNLEREQVIKEQTKEWLFYNNLIREGSE